MWQIEPGNEAALEGVCARSPALKHLLVRFNERPSLDILLDLLRHVPALEELQVAVEDCKDPDGADEAGAVESNDEGDDSAVAKDAEGSEEPAGDAACVQSNAGYRGSDTCDDSSASEGDEDLDVQQQLVRRLEAQHIMALRQVQQQQAHKQQQTFSECVQESERAFEAFALQLCPALRFVNFSSYTA
jgi:hypothetical protein